MIKNTMMILNLKRLATFLPGLKLLQHYSLAWLRGDVLAGIAVAAYLVPQCMAYAELAGVPPVVGLWAILPSILIYTLLGSSPQLSIGPESTTAVMTAAAIAPLAATDGSNYAVLSSLLAILVGLVCWLGAFAKLGFLADLLSKPILVGYMTGVAMMMMSSQLGKISGLSIEAESLLGQLQAFGQHWEQVHLPTLMLAAGLLLLLQLIRWWSPNAPASLLMMLVATAVVYLFELEQHGVAVIGEIPGDLPRLTLETDFSALSQITPLVLGAISIALVGYSDNVLTARAFADRNRYHIDPDQELLALGAANIGSGLLQGFPVSSSGSRTAIGDALGSRSQLYSLVAFTVVVFVLLCLRPLLALFPKAALGVIVIYAALRLIDTDEFKRLYHFKHSELRLAVITLIGVLATDILTGVGIAVAVSVIDLFARLMRPHDAVMGEVPNLAGLHDVDDWADAKTIPGLVIYRYDAPLCFANAENFRLRAMNAIRAEKTPVEWLVMNTEAVVEIDITAVDMLIELHRELAAQQITFAMARVKQDFYVQLKRGGLVELIGQEKLYPTLHTAIAAFHARKSA